MTTDAPPLNDPRHLLHACCDARALPSLPGAVLKLIELCRREGVGLRELADCIAHDPALTAQIIRAVNSGAYGVREPVTTLSHAVNVLGLRTVKMIALGACYTKTYRADSGEPFDLTPFWRRAAYAAAATRAVCDTLHTPDADETALAATLQDLGVLALLALLKERYARLLDRVGPDCATLSELERQLLGTDHAEVGRALAESWGLPEPLPTIIAFHEKPNVSPPEHRAKIMIIALGTAAADTAAQPDPSDHLRQLAQRAADWFQISDTHVADVLTSLKYHAPRYAGLFGLQIHDPDHEAHLAYHAKELLHDLSIEAQQELLAATHSKRQVEDVARKDPLTGVANRGHFNRVFCQHCRQAIRRERPLSLMMIDCDHFKKVNDTHGHLAGDHVLRTVASLLVEHTPDKADVARIGGEEFAVVVPDLPRDDALRLAEQLRLTVQSTGVTTDAGVTLKITASFGVATQVPGKPFDLPLDFIRVADECAYAAKRAGRNTVCHAASDDPTVRGVAPTKSKRAG